MIHSDCTGLLKDFLIYCQKRQISLLGHITITIKLVNYSLFGFQTIL